MTRSELWDLLDSPLDKTNGTPIGRKRGCAFSVKKAVDKTHWTPFYVFVQKYNFSLPITRATVAFFRGVNNRAQTYLQPNYGNGGFGKVYLSAGQH